VALLIASCLVGLVLLEIGLRWARYVRRDISFWKSWERPAPKVLSYERHPYLFYVKRPNVEGLHPSNSLGYAGKREVFQGRLPRSVRIYCAGGSPVEFNDPAEGPDSSWPGKLQDILSARFPEVIIECINAGVAGYTSAESLSDFLFRGIELKPDILLVYHNGNDAWMCQMVDGFKADYSHARLPKPWNVGWINRIPQIPWLASYQLVWDWVTQKWGKASGLLFWISDPPWKTVGYFRSDAVQTFRRNITHLVRAAQACSCHPVLIKWECNWSARKLPPFLERRPETVDVYFEFLHANNKALESIASDSSPCSFLDVGPFEPAHFFSDTVHFSPSGIVEMAHRVANGIEPLVRSIIESKTGGIHEPLGQHAGLQKEWHG